MVETKEILDAAQAKMDKVIGFLTEELTSVRAGKASTNILNGIMVDYYGTPTPVSQVASITVPDARTVLVQPWEKKMIAPLEKAILVANIGLTPSNNGEHIRLNIPPLTEERRKELVKQIKGDTETARVSLRGIRRDMVEAFKKAQKEGMPEDVVGIGAIWYLWALFWGKLLLAEINRTPCPFVISLALFVVGTSTTGIVWLPFAIQSSLCAVLFMHIGQIVRLQDLLHRIPPLLWVCALCTWLYCGAFFGHLYMESNYFQHGAMEVIGGVCGALCLIKFGEALSRRAPSVARPIAWLGSITLPLFCMHLVELNVIPWDMVTDACVRAGITPWVGAFLLHVAAIAVLCVALRFAPRPISGAFYK